MPGLRHKEMSARQVSGTMLDRAVSHRSKEDSCSFKGRIKRATPQGIQKSTADQADNIVPSSRQCPENRKA